MVADDVHFFQIIRIDFNRFSVGFEVNTVVAADGPGAGIDVVYIMLVFRPRVIGIKSNLLVDVGVDMIDPYADDILIFNGPFLAGR